MTSLEDALKKWQAQFGQDLPTCETCTVPQRYGQDQYRCNRCGMVWDIDELRPPCEVNRQAEGK